MLDNFNNIQPGFYRDSKFPYGFDRSGDFTTKQADLLSKFGNTLIKLESGEVEPSTLEEKRFVNVCKGEKEPESFVETTWVRYRKLSKKTASVSAFSSSHKPGVGDSEDIADNV